jgi:hypothetical protein
VKVFLDECVDWRLARDIVGHDVKTARQMGWTTIKNGTLLTLASEHFDAFVTVDRNLSFQQTLDSFSIAVVVLQAKTNRLSDIAPNFAGLISVTHTSSTLRIIQYNTPRLRSAP